MLSGFFKPAWQHSEASKRIDAIDLLNPDDHKSLEVLISLATEDVDPAVRTAAMGRLPWRSLVEVMDAHKNPEVQTLAIETFDHLLSTEDGLQESETTQISSAYPKLASRIAALSRFSDVRSKLVDEAPEAELSIILNITEYSETRRQIAEKLQSLDALEAARKQLKGKDRSAEKIIKAKIDAIRARQREDEENRQASSEICEKMHYLETHIESLTSKDRLPEFKRKFLAASSQWDKLSFEPEAPIRERYNSAFDAVSKRYFQQEAIDKVHSAQSALLGNLAQLVKDIADYNALQLSDSVTRIKAELAEYRAQWEKLANEARADLQIADKYFLTESAIKSAISFAEDIAEKNAESSTPEPREPSKQVNPREDKEVVVDAAAERAARLKQAVADLKWPSNFGALEAAIETAQEIEDLKQHNQQQKKQHKERIDKLHKRINRILGAARRGEIGRARGELDAVTKASNEYSGKDKSQLDDRIAKAREAVEKMGDWKDFATEPKYIALCEAMEALKKSDKQPEALAKEIKALQDQWKQLGHSDAAELHWQRFKTAGDQAYEPCALFFEKRNETRKQNLEKREQIHQQLLVLFESTDWDGRPDYKTIETAMRQSMDRWKKIKDVEPGAGHKQWKRFSNLRDKFNEQLSTVYEANLELKEQLIEQATSLNEKEVSEQSMTQLQQLQTRWKQVGITRRKEDQIVWKKFKAATDRVYEKVKGIRQTKRDAENEQIDAYRNINKQIQELAKSATDLADADHRFSSLESSYSELPPLPKDLAEKFTENLAKDHARACNNYAKRRDQLVANLANKELAALQEKARLCTELERAINTSEKEEIDRLLSEIRDIPLGSALQKRFDERLDSVHDKDRTKATEQRRLMCIDLEILLGAESPEEDRELRMKIQFDRMKTQGLGNTNQDKNQQIQETKLDWLCKPGAEPSVQAQLNQRIEKLLS